MFCNKYIQMSKTNLYYVITLRPNGLNYFMRHVVPFDNAYPLSFYVDVLMILKNDV